MKVLLSLIIVTSLALVGCTKKQDANEKVLNVLVSAKIKGMDPATSDDLYSSNEVGRVYEGLLEYHYLKRPYTLVPNLAAAMPEVSKDGLTYTFKIKQGVLFHNDNAFSGGKGRELEAADFVYSIKRLADPKIQSSGWWLLDGKIVGLNEWRDSQVKSPKVDYSLEVEGLKAIDKYTLQFKLKKNVPQFLYALAMPFTFVVAKEVVEKYGQEFLNHPVGTGPFVIPEFKQTNELVYTKNPTFREKLYPSDASPEYTKHLTDAGKKLPLVEKVVVKVIIEDQPGWLQFQKGNIDAKGVPKDNFATTITPSKDLSPEFKTKGIELDISPSLDITYSAFNLDNKLFQNKKLRQAIAMAFDRPADNKLFFNDTALEAQGPVPPGIAGNIKGYVNPYMIFSVEKAKKLLAEAGYPEGKGLPEITYDVSAGSTARQGGEFFAKNMAAIGIKVKVVENPWPTLQQKVQNRQIMMFGMAWGADYPDAENFLQLFYSKNRSPGPNSSGYNDPSFDKEFELAITMQDSPERTAKYEALNKKIAEEVPVMWGFHRQGYLLTQGWLKNHIQTDFTTGQSQYLNIDLEKKKELLKKF